MHHKLQKGCLEALHLLSYHYPPATMPDVWGCLDKPYSILTVLLQLLTSSKIVWGIQGNINFTLGLVVVIFNTKVLSERLLL